MKRLKRLRHKAIILLSLRSRAEEDNAKAKYPDCRSRRWVVCHSWFNHFHKLLVRYEKIDRSYLALLRLASAIIAFRKVPAQTNIIYR